VFRGFDTPAAAGPNVAFRAILDQSREAVFLARGRCRMALAGTGEAAPSGGGRFTTFGTPTFAGGRAVFRGNVIGGTAPIAFYRATPAGPCTRIPPTLDVLTVAGAPSPFLDLGPPSGNRRASLVFAADLTGAGPTDTVLFLSP
jgi:hypothetical protein